MHAPVGQQAQQMERGAGGHRRVHRGAQDGILRERPVGHAAVDAREVLIDHAAGTQIEVADLGVTHLLVG